MSLYHLIRLLSSNGFKFVKAYGEYEIWQRQEKSLTIPTTHDTINLRVAKDLKSKILKY